MSFFPTQAIAELASEFKLLRKDIQAMRKSLERIEQKLVGVPEPTNKLPPAQSPPNQPSSRPSPNLFKNQIKN